jgi:hypothetical protein
VHLQSDVVAFRGAPEELFTVSEFVPCDQLMATLNDSAVQELL